MGRAFQVLIPLFIALPAWGLDWMSVRGDSISWSPFRLNADFYVIEHFSPGCGPCRKNVPNVNELVRKIRAAKLRAEVVHLSNDEQDPEMLAWYKAVSPNHGVIRDEDWKLTAHLRKSNPTSGVPATYVIDHEQNVLYAHVGMWGSEVEGEILKILKSGQRKSPTKVRTPGPSSPGSSDPRESRPRVPSAGSRSELD